MACAGRMRWPWSSTCISALTMPSMRVTRTTPPAPGSRPSCTSGKPSSDLRVVDDDPVVAGERDLQAAAERGAVDRGDDRLAERLQPAQQRLVLAHPAGELVGRLGRDLLEVVEVAAGEERLLRARDDDARDRVLLGLQPLDGRLIEAPKSAFIVLADWFGSSRVRRLTTPSSPACPSGSCRSAIRSPPRRSRCPCRRRCTAWRGRSGRPCARARRSACRGSCRRSRRAGGPSRSRRR